MSRAARSDASRPILLGGTLAADPRGPPGRIRPGRIRPG